MTSSDLQPPGASAPLVVRDPASGRIAGVCAALSQRTGVDVRLLRILAVVLAVSAGSGVALYVAAWLLTPSRRDPVPPLSRLMPSTADWDNQMRLRVLGFIAAVTVVICSVAWPMSFVPLVILVLAWWLSRRPSVSGTTPAQPLPAPRPVEQPTEFTMARDAWLARLHGLDAAPEEPARPGPASGYVTAGRSPAAPVGEPWAREVRPVATLAPVEDVLDRRRADRRNARLLGLVVVGLAALTAALADRLLPHVAHREFTAYAIALGVLGLGLLVCAPFRRPRFVVPAGIILALLMGANSLGIDRQGPHNIDLSYSAASALPAAPLRVTAGSGMIDLHKLTLTSDTQFALDAKASNVTILVPESMPLQVKYDIAASKLTILDQNVAGFTADTKSIDGQGTARLVIVVNAKASTVVIRHA